jgi:hypothetical protein
MKHVYLKKDLWSKIVRQSISISEENRWLENIENRPELLRYSKIHSTLTEHRLILLTLVYPNIKRELLVLVKLGSMAIKKATCPLCCVNSSDILLHLIMSCHVLTERNELHYKIVDVLPRSAGLWLIVKVKFVFNQDWLDFLYNGYINFAM